MSAAQDKNPSYWSSLDSDDRPLLDCSEHGVIKNPNQVDFYHG
jgi:hypothetical protein